MLPAPFEYHRPDTLEEALQLLAEHGEDAKVLAGGQSLIPLMKLRFAAPARLIDVNRISGLDGLQERDGLLRIGALVRHNQLAASDVIKDRYPTIAAAAPMISDPIVRNLGTVGGSRGHGRRSQQRWRARDRGRRPSGRPVPELDRRERAAHRGPSSLTEFTLRWDISQARAQGRGFRNGRGRHLPHARERVDRHRRHRPHVGGAHEP